MRCVGFSARPNHPGGHGAKGHPGKRRYVGHQEVLSDGGDPRARAIGRAGLPERPSVQPPRHPERRRRAERRQRENPCDPSGGGNWLAGPGAGGSDQVVTRRRSVMASLGPEGRCGRLLERGGFAGGRRAIAFGNLRPPLVRVVGARASALLAITRRLVRWNARVVGSRSRGFARCFARFFDRRGLGLAIQARQPLFTVFPNQGGTAGIGTNEQLLL